MCNCFLGNIWQQILPWQQFFMFLGLRNTFWSSLHSKPLHELELISLTTITGNTFFSVSWGHEYFYGFFAFQTPAQTGAELVFWQHLATSVAMATLFFVSWTYIFVGSLHSKPLHE